ncbi:MULTISPECIES: type II toxin-antitoxin system VapC family toxin [Rhizobium]|uniref:Putative nucleic acid-binding protein n=1 Tax=Rhizobium wenxiniae TaxID=1737357 RepID=A0A7W9YC61_9HYPH|nr:type II toxin-antitoxin system VapC family toxin [Rhizobium wenxiniae]MBB6165712.1 putative nucleic acid-binding protein [Rhizobium wenxiniae]GGG16492.1 ribonuclease VapC [Rhizobium wenxiniae]
MPFVMDASMAAAWLLPEDFSDAAEAVIATIDAPCPVPTLFFFEIRNILSMSERRGRISAGGALVNMERVRRLPLDDAGIGGDSYVLLLSANHGLSAYDAAYLALALNRTAPLATLDRKLAAAARKEGVPVLGPFANVD